MHEVTAHYRQEDGASVIDISLNRVQQLFNSLDPSPFHEKDLDTDAEDYIVGAAREIPRHAPLKLVFHLPPEAIEEADRAGVGRGICNYFEYRRDAAVRDLRLRLHEGRRALAIGIAFVAACIGLRELIHAATVSTFGAIAGESLLILGWVAMWRPLQIFLYDWWPVRRLIGVYAKLAAAPVELRASAPMGD